MQPGDVFATNDPYSGGGTHLSDVCLIGPIIYDGELVAFAANKGHWTELGGMAPGSWTTDATEIYQEGLQLPAVRVYDAGRAGAGHHRPHRRQRAFARHDAQRPLRRRGRHTRR